MRGKIRKAILLTATLSFVVFSMQITLLVHILCEEHHGGHDSHKCPVCQQLLTVVNTLKIERPTTVGQVRLCERSAVLDSEIIFEIPQFRPLGPRAPPASL